MRPTWAETCALFVYMVILSFSGFGLYTGISFANSAHSNARLRTKIRAVGLGNSILPPGDMSLPMGSSS